jgi:hypothetical protein
MSVWEWITVGLIAGTVLVIVGFFIWMLIQIIEAYGCLECEAPQGQYLRGECCEWARGEYMRLYPNRPAPTLQRRG